ncbi:polysaccharide deacetylase family protein [Sulfurovum sp.]|uniref:polysaccharide deacetylase family protein n=1 Tax=Sulfurovum sp. TaxID=1969726 RepID=UPI002867DCC4|nr:polysaccharide deacetylase family protein [Sulfurovum sp.]
MTTYFILSILLMAIYFSYRYAWWKRAVDYRYPRILMYHMVRDSIPGKKFNSLRVSPENFEIQIKYLHDNGWHSYTMTEAIFQKKNLPSKSVVITFDDGYQDNLTNALPILKKYGFKATIYLVNDRQDRDWSGYRKAKNEGAGLKEESKLSDDEVRELLGSGLIEIGAHTLTHVNLNSLSAEEAQNEICVSKERIEAQFQTVCHSFAYPFGLYSPRDKKIVAGCNYTNAVTTKVGIADLNECNSYEIPRVTVSGKDNFFVFILKLKTGKRGVRK